MEKQWKEAVTQLNDNVLNQKIMELNERLTGSNIELIRLRKENQSLKL